MKLGDKVKVVDYSYGQRIDSYEKHDNSFSLCRDAFEIIEFTHTELVTAFSKNKVHDIIIRNIKNGNVYLHTEAFVRSAEPCIKELTMADVEAKFGHKVKIIK